MNDRLVPVTIIGGYLGAGKTSLVNHILRHTDVPLAVVVNDFGDVDVDASLLDSGKGEILSFANGCVCCDLSDGLVNALDRLRSLSPTPQRIVIESSGVSELGTLANYAALPGLRLDATVCVVDSETLREKTVDRWVGDLVVGQLLAADFILCNKVDVVDEATRLDTRACIAELTTDAIVLDAICGNIDPDVLFDHRVSTLCVSLSDSDRSHNESLSASERFISWVCTFTEPLGLDELHQALDELPTSLVRAKGIVSIHVDNQVKPALVQVVGRRREVTELPTTVGGHSVAVSTSFGSVSCIALRNLFDPWTLPQLFRPSNF